MLQIVQVLNVLLDAYNGFFNRDSQTKLGCQFFKRLVDILKNVLS